MTASCSRCVTAGSGKFCAECGSPLGEKAGCGSCGARLKAGALYCSECGGAVGQPESVAPGDHDPAAVAADVHRHHPEAATQGPEALELVQTRRRAQAVQEHQHGSAPRTIHLADEGGAAARKLDRPAGGQDRSAPPHWAPTG